MKAQFKKISESLVFPVKDLVKSGEPRYNPGDGSIRQYSCLDSSYFGDFLGRRHAIPISGRRPSSQESLRPRYRTTRVYKPGPPVSDTCVDCPDHSHHHRVSSASQCGGHLRITRQLAASSPD